MDKADSLRFRAVRQLITVARRHHTMAENAVRTLEIHSAQHHLLMYLTFHSGATQTEIARHFDVSSANIASLLKKMEAAGLIRRAASLPDTRFRQVEITEKGKQIVEATRVMFDEMDNRVFDGFTDEEINTLCGLLTRLDENIRREEQEDEGQP